MANIVEAYHTGVVFDETDIRRIVNTNLKVMWNGSLEEPAFRNSNATLPGVESMPKSTRRSPVVVAGGFRRHDPQTPDGQSCEGAQFGSGDREGLFRERDAATSGRFRRGRLRQRQAEGLRFSAGRPVRGSIMAAALPASFSAEGRNAARLRVIHQGRD